MVQKIVNIPEEDLSLFLELAKKFDWEVMPKTSRMEEPEIGYVLSPQQVAILEESSKTTSHLHLSAEESLRKLDEL
jgi:hypothetical protein